MKKRIVFAISLICISLVVGLSYFLLRRNNPNELLGLESDAKDLLSTTHHLDNFIFFSVNGKKYGYLSLEQRVEYGLLTKEEAKPVFPPRQDPDWYKHQFVRGDIGEWMGTVENSTFPLIEGFDVYYYAAYPDTDDICIVDLGIGYEFYGVCR